MKTAINISDNESKKEHKDNKKILTDRDKLKDFIDTYNILQDYIKSNII